MTSYKIVKNIKVYQNKRLMKLKKFFGIIPRHQIMFKRHVYNDGVMWSVYVDITAPQLLDDTEIVKSAKKLLKEKYNITLKENNLVFDTVFQNPVQEKYEPNIKIDYEL